MMTRSPTAFRRPSALDGTQSGSMLITASVIAMIVSGLALAFFSTTFLSHLSTSRSIDEEVAFLNAEAGLQAALSEIQRTTDMGSDGLGNCVGGINGGAYAVTISPAWSGPKTYVLTATGSRGTSTRALEAVIDFPEKIFTRAAFANRSLFLHSSTFVDSYDSSLGSYASQRVNTDPGGNSIANSNGTVGGNSNLEIHGVVNGNAVPGVDDVILWGSQGIVSGATLPATAETELPPIDLGSAATLNNNDTLSQSAFDPSTRVFHLQSGSMTLSAGTYFLRSFEVSPGATLIIDDSVTIYVERSMEVNGAVVNASENPALLHVMCMDETEAGEEDDDDRPHVSMGSNAVFHGLLYAPKSWVRIGSNAEVFGSIVAEDMELLSGASCHFDEELGGQQAGTANLRILALMRE